MEIPPNFLLHKKTPPGKHFCSWVYREIIKTTAKGNKKIIFVKILRNMKIIDKILNITPNIA